MKISQKLKGLEMINFMLEFVQMFLLLIIAVTPFMIGVGIIILIADATGKQRTK